MFDFFLFYCCDFGCKKLNLSFYLKKKHLFKKRVSYSLIYNQQKFITYKCIYSVKRFKLEFVYIRFLKKIFRRKFIKRKMRFFKPKFWVFMVPNFILSKKSKNARMGAGVGKFVRLVSMINPQKTFLKTWQYRVNFLKFVTKYLKYKISNKFLIKKCYK